jgi:integrase
MMPAVGRRKWVWHDLPPRMKARKLASGRVLYYYQAAGKQIPLGANRLKANEEWARLEAGGVGGAMRFHQISAIYRSTFTGLAASTRAHYRIALDNLDAAFKTFTLDDLQPKHVKEYMRRRTKKGAARLERRVLSAFFNWARGEGHTAAPNPCHGIKFSKSERATYGGGPRKVYVTDEQFREVWDRADDTVKDAMDLALITGQRPSDLLKARRQDIADGVLWIAQEKTGKRLGIRVEGELQRVVARVLGRQRDVPSMYLLCDRQGQRLTYPALYARFQKALAGAGWQFRDLRAKAATDSPDLKRAQMLLGHESEQTTAGVYRRSRGEIVSPLERKI